MFQESQTKFFFLVQLLLLLEAMTYRIPNHVNCCKLVVRAQKLVSCHLRCLRSSLRSLGGEDRKSTMFYYVHRSLSLRNFMEMWRYVSQICSGSNNKDTMTFQKRLFDR
ncbi:hypothetical protein K450DRAFT_242059 [Umbelopsis ramanniana AG]|uniref:Secreted protein n=1 Tax=Umbelopsis ramanniana AG TaxID=1314678 RepID=A0AAD5E9Y8_UMBRA|nr:uncharacterized protein K450DRAFT_242059 [Umbelopsis ramanniana AG]KAI8579417.1 hypothetical protein K450DRAFT_242059 [Umbelopsis ramanniana AG]